MKKTFALFLLLLATCMLSAQIVVFTEDFEANGIPAGWTTIDADGDGFNWRSSISLIGSGYGHNGSSGCILSQSYDNNDGILYPDNWLITPAINLTANGTLTFWVCSQDNVYAEEHYGVYISTTSATDTSAFTLLFEETISDPVRTQTAWVQHSIDLSAYTGNVVYIAFRHFDVYDMFYLDLDDVTVTIQTTDPLITATPNAFSFNTIVGGSVTSTALVKTYNITGNVTASTSLPFAVSTDNTSFGTTATLTAGDSILYIQYAPVAAGLDSAVITLSSSGASPITILVTATATEAATLPYSQNFENAAENLNWVFVNDGTNIWQIGNAVNTTENGEFAMYISNDQGVSNTYNNSATSVSWAYRDIDFGNYPEYSLSFMFRGQGENANYDYMKVFIGEPIEQLPLTWSYSAATPQGLTELGKYMLTPNWTPVSLTLTAEYAGPQRLYFFWWNDNSVGTNPPAAVDDITIVGANCASPTDIQVSNISIDGATLSWEGISNNSGYNIAVSTESGFNPDQCTTVYTSATTSYDINGLSANTHYYFRVQSDCGGGDLSVWSPQMTFQTLAGLPAATPYANGFDDAEENGKWVLANGNETNQWYIGQPTGETDSMLFISNDGSTATYANSSTYVWAYRDIQFGDAAEFSFDMKWKCAGESSYDYIKVFLGNPLPVEAGNSAAPNGAVQIGGILNQQTSWQHLTQPLDASYANTTKRLYILWHNDNSVSHDPSAIIDSIAINVSLCGRPYDLAVNNITTSSAEFSFSPATSTDNEWEYAICDETETPENAAITGTTNDTVFTVSTLTSATYYTIYMRTPCADGSYSAWSDPYTFFVNCEDALIPFEENFDSLSIGDFPICWRRANTYSASTEYPYVSGSYSVSDDNSLFFYSGSTSYNLAVLPHFDVSLNPINTLMLSFYLRTSSVNMGVIVGVMDNPAELSTFTPIDTIFPSTAGEFEYAFVPLASYTGNGEYVAMKSYTTSYSSMYIDNIVLDVASSCLPVSGITCTGTTSSTATLSWVSNGTETNWNIEYGPTGFTQGSEAGTTVSADSNPFTIDDLVSGSTYDFYVQADCSGEESIWMGPVTVTPGSYNMPITGNNTITTCEMIIYDNGGANGDYSSNCASTLTIYPETPGSIIAIGGTVNVESGFDELTIYDGVGTSGTVLGSYSNTGITVPELTSSTGPITLYFESDGSVQYSGFALTVSCASATCHRPTNLIISNVGTTYADISWTPGGSESSWIVEYKETTSSTWISNTVTTPSFQLTNLTELTSYNVRVKADCGDETSSYTSETFNTMICDPSNTCTYTFVLGDGYGDGWNGGSLEVQQNGVTIATLAAIDHDGDDEQTYDTATVSLCDGVSTSLVWNMGDYDDEVSITLLGPDGTMLFSVFDLEDNYASPLHTFTTDCSGSGPVVTNPTVTTGNATAVGQTSATLNATITNPDNVTITAKGFEWKTTTGGTYTQVASTGTGNTFTANLTGLTASTGYTYKAFITYNGQTVYGSENTFTTQSGGGPEACDVPTNITTSNITKESITVAWDNSDVTSWNVQYRPQNGTLSSATTTTNSYQINGLTPLTTYEIQVQAVCANGQTSEWSAIVTATTLPDGIENHLDKSVSLFPNPAKEYVDIRVDGDVNVTLMEVIDVYGKVIRTVETFHETSLQTTRLNVSGLADGMYFVRVTTDAGVVTKPFVKK